MYLLTFMIVTFYCLTPQFADKTCNVFSEKPDYVWVEGRDEAKVMASEIIKGVQDGFGKKHFVKVDRFVLRDVAGPTDEFE